MNGLTLILNDWIDLYFYHDHNKSNFFFHSINGMFPIAWSVPAHNFEFHKESLYALVIGVICFVLSDPMRIC